MLIRYSPPTKEISITGSREDHSALASLIKNASGTMSSNQTGSPEPYEKLLRAIVIEEKLGMSVCFTVTQDGDLSITGDKRKLGQLAVNVESFAKESADNHHSHEEYFPGHFYLAPDSFPVVFQFKIPGREFSTLQ